MDVRPRTRYFIHLSIDKHENGADNVVGGGHKPDALSTLPDRKKNMLIMKWVLGIYQMLVHLFIERQENGALNEADLITSNIALSNEGELYKY